MTTQQLNEKFPLRDSGVSNSQDAVSLPRHRWYGVKESFSPTLVEAALKEVQSSSEDIVVDPFCGSGTVPLVASLQNRRAVAIEVNPFLAFVARTKLIETKPHNFDDAVRATVAGVERGQESSLENYSTFAPAGGATKWLFNEEVIRAFEGGWSAASQLDATSRDLLQLGLIGAAMDACNADKDGKCLRYRRNWKDLALGRKEFLAALRARMTIIGDDLDTCPNSVNKGEVISGDSRQDVSVHIDPTQHAKFTLCVTSPPYLNSFDYSDIYRPELFLGKWVTSTQELAQIRHRTLRSHVGVSWEKPTEKDFGLLYTKAMEELDGKTQHLWDSRLPLMIQAYFQDMKQVLTNLSKAAHPKASLWLVVSTSAYAGVEIPVDLIIAHIGSKTGWYLSEVGVLRHLRASGQHWSKWSNPENEKPRLRESIVILDKTPRPKRH